jgi:A/G-specific adenine glycosylase
MSGPCETGPSVKTTRALIEWFRQSARDLPWRKTRDPYAIWVSEIMLQQTQVKTVIPYWERWMKELPTIRALADAPPERIHKLWEGLGYYTRVRNLQRAAQEILQQHDGVFPREHEAVLELMGVGRYTAGAICSIAFDQPQPILDGNVIRVLTRLFAIDTDPKSKPTNELLWTLAQQFVQRAAGLSDLSPPRCGDLNQAMMELGATICVPRDPKCDGCPIAKDCAARRQNRVEELPRIGPRVQPTSRRFVAFVVEQRGRYLVRQRPAGMVNAHLWEFPNCELVAGTEAKPPVELSWFDPGKEPLAEITHSITRYRISLQAFRARLKRSPTTGMGVWRTLKELHALPFTSAHKKILQRVTVSKA